MFRLILDEVWSFTWATLLGLIVGATVSGLIIGTLVLAHAIKL
jgi:hypothetical protein